MQHQERLPLHPGAANLVLSLAKLLLGVLEGARGKGSDLAPQTPTFVASLSASARIPQNNYSNSRYPYVRLFWNDLKSMVDDGR